VSIREHRYPAGGALRSCERGPDVSVVLHSSAYISITTAYVRVVSRQSQHVIGGACVERREDRREERRGEEKGEERGDKASVAKVSVCGESEHMIPERLSSVCACGSEHVIRERRS
jgi:hypothetical protein